MDDTYGGVQGDTQQWGSFAPLAEAEMQVGLNGKIARTPWSDFLERYGSLRIHEAELFHCNSRITSASQVNVPLSADRVGAIRSWMDREGYAPKEGTLDEAVSDRVGFTRIDSDRGLQGITMDKRVSSALAVELYIAIGCMVYRVRNHRLWLERKLSFDDATRMTDCLDLDQPRCRREARYLILYTGFPWRYMAFQGPRGYRRMLVELGEQISNVERVLQFAGLTAATSLDFYDVTIESLLGFDGIETTLLATTTVFGSGDCTNAAP